MIKRLALLLTVTALIAAAVAVGITALLVNIFTRKVEQSGVIAAAKQVQYFEKPISKRDRRQKAIVRRERKLL